MKKLRKCYACFSGYGCEKQKLPRKKKKQLKKAYFDIDIPIYTYFFDGLTSCDLEASYKFYREIINKLPFFKKWKTEIKMLMEYCEYSGERIYIDEKGRLSWFWEYDGDYSASEGVMAFCYSEEEAGDTWAFSEVKMLLVHILDIHDKYDFPKEIKSDRDLLAYIRKAK